MHVWYNVDANASKEFVMFSANKIYQQAEYYLMGARNPLNRYNLACDLVRLMVKLGYLPTQTVEMVRPVRMPTRVEDLAPENDRPPILGPDALNYVDAEDQEDSEAVRNLFRKNTEDEASS
jgi:hypothetical protein